MVAPIDAMLKHTPDDEPLAEKELDTTGVKFPGPDDIPNLIFIEANKNTRKMYLEMFNHIIK